ncbi:hypothetical protein WAI453_003058 [Rhynchosporium graminicola]|uniref:ATP-binding protein n=1 Tax=Rhynchosporium graminicola TaxID=2792576 RepID=A0A1E1LJ97_9HELO|nr:uncharacterized protein RCO7_07539 [Rhynchosporium commune]
MSGTPGSGKSSMAKLLASAIDGIVIDHNILRSSFLDADIPFHQAAKHAYDLQWRLAEDFIKQGAAHSIIIDSTCNYLEVLNRGSFLAAQHNFTYWYIECKVDDIDLLDQWLRSRSSMKSQRTGVDCSPASAPSADRDSRAIFRKWMDHPCRPNDNNIILDTTSNLKTLRDDALKQILKSE